MLLNTDRQAEVLLTGRVAGVIAGDEMSKPLAMKGEGVGGGEHSGFKEVAIRRHKVFLKDSKLLQMHFELLTSCPMADARSCDTHTHYPSLLTWQWDSGPLSGPPTALLGWSLVVTGQGILPPGGALCPWV